MKGLNKNNIQKYIQNLFPNQKCTLLACKEIKEVMGLLQKDYGELQDCTLTSATAMLQYYTKDNIWKIYHIVEQYAKKRGYKGDVGTNPIVIRYILLDLIKYYKLKKSAYSAYLKNLAFNFDSIKKLIDNNIPVILNISNDGRGYYKDHSVLIIGYEEYKTTNNQKIQLLKIKDNWDIQTSYLDFSKMSVFSSINYMI